MYRLRWPSAARTTPADGPSGVARRRWPPCLALSPMPGEEEVMAHEGAGAAAAEGSIYVAGGGSKSIAHLGIAADGTLSQLPGSPYPVGSVPASVVGSPDGRLLYVTNYGSDNVVGFRTAADGSLSPLPGSPYPADKGAGGVAVTPDGQRLYVANFHADNLSGFNITDDGSLSALRGSPYAIVQTAGRGAAGRVVAWVLGTRLAALVAGRRQLSPFLSEFYDRAGAVAEGSWPGGVTISPNGQHLYVAIRHFVAGYRIKEDGSLDPLPGSPYAADDGTYDVAMTPDGRFLYASNRTAANVDAYRIGADGSLSRLPTSPYPADGRPYALTATPDGRFLYVAAGPSKTVVGFRIAADGGLTPLSGSPYVAG